MAEQAEDRPACQRAFWKAYLPIENTLKRAKELEQQIGQIALGGAGQGDPELHEFLVTLVTHLFEAEAQAKKLA
jgi:hypothetical protein